jgi:hypothetical protein
VFRPQGGAEMGALKYRLSKRPLRLRGEPAANATFETADANQPAGSADQIKRLVQPPARSAIKRLLAGWRPSRVIRANNQGPCRGAPESRALPNVISIRKIIVLDCRLWSPQPCPVRMMT